MPAVVTIMPMKSIVPRPLPIASVPVRLVGHRSAPSVLASLTTKDNRQSIASIALNSEAIAFADAGSGHDFTD
jgi:hypothetical protein